MGAAALVVVLASLALASPASASTLTATNVTPPDYIPPFNHWCGDLFRFDYTAKAGEANNLDTEFVSGVPTLLIPAAGPWCPSETPHVATFTDFRAKITTVGSRCSAVAMTVATCHAYDVVGFLITVGDKRDIVRLPGGRPPATVNAGAGKDSVNVFNRSRGGDTVICGSGIDGVTADTGDSVAADCEKVTRY